MTPIPERAAKTTAGNNTRSGIGMGMSLPSAEFISFWANWLLVGALVVGVIATWGIVVSGNVKETALKRDLGEAVARASEANARALQAELELVKYRVGRSLGEEQKRQMEEVLKSAPKGPVIIKPNFLSPEPTRYGNELSEVFNKSGFSNVGDKPLSVVSTNLPGLFLVIRDKEHIPPQATAIMGAFHAANIPITAHEEEYVPDVNTVVILVGERP